MSIESDFLEAFETHSPEDIRASLAAGASPIALIGGKRPIDILIEMYTRSPRFADCLRVMMAAGADTGDPLLEAALLDDDGALRPVLAESPLDIGRKGASGCLTVLGAVTEKPSREADRQTGAACKVPRINDPFPSADHQGAE